MSLLELPSANRCTFSFPRLELGEDVWRQVLKAFRTQSTCGHTFIEWSGPGILMTLFVASRGIFKYLLLLSGSRGRAPARWCTPQIGIRRLYLGWLILAAEDAGVVTPQGRARCAWKQPVSRTASRSVVITLANFRTGAQRPKYWKLT